MSTVPARPIKIMRVITRLNIGGPAQQAVYLTERMSDGRSSAALVAGALGPGDGDMSPMAVRRSVPVTFVPALSNGSGIVGDLRALLHLYRLIRRERPSVVHLHLLKARALGGIAARLAGVPLVVETLHGHLLQGYYGAIGARFVLAIERVIGRWLADAVIALSDGQRQALLRWRIAAPAKIHVVPLGLELEPFLADPAAPGSLRRELGIGEDRFVVGAVGRFVPIKGYGVLLRAVQKLAPVIGGQLVVVLVGDGPLRGELEAEAERLRIRHLVRFLGWRTDVAHVYPDLDVMVQPSFNEGTPVSLIEAMAAARPVIATRVGGVPDVVDDGRSGLLVPPGDPAALAEAVQRLWRDPVLRRRLGDEGRRAVYPRYGLDRLVAQLTDLYLRLLLRKAVTHPQEQAPATAGRGVLEEPR